MKKSISAILISVILVTFAFGTAFAKEEYRIKFGYSASDKEANIITFYNTFEKYVEEASGGRIAVDVYANAQLGGERQMLEGMTLGTIEMAMLSPGIAANIAPKFQVIDLPYLFNDRAAAYKALDGKLGQTLNDQILPKGVRLLCFPENGFRQITNNKAPIKSPADLKGVKVRVQPIPAHLELFKAFGANPTPVDFGELYTALLQKTVDAQENSITLIYSSKLYEVQKYLTMSNHVYAPSAVKPEIRSSISVWLRLMTLISSFSLSMAACFWARDSSLFSRASVLRSRFSSFSYSLRFFKISSLASSSASFFLVSALLMASLMMRFPSSSALEISFSETVFR